MMEHSDQFVQEDLSSLVDKKGEDRYARLQLQQDYGADPLRSESNTAIEICTIEVLLQHSVEVL